MSSADGGDSPKKKMHKTKIIGFHDWNNIEIVRKTSRTTPLSCGFFQAICLNCCLSIQMQYVDVPLLFDGYKTDENKIETTKKFGNFQHQQCLDEFIYRFG